MLGMERLDYVSIVGSVYMFLMMEIYRYVQDVGV